MSKDAVETLEKTRQELINKLLERKRQIEAQLRGLGHEDNKKSPG